MCGIIGFFGKPTHDNLKRVAKLWLESTYRGLHSHGFYVKPVGGPPVMLINEPMSKLANLLSTMTEGFNLIGHTRYCTSDPETPQPIRLSTGPGKQVAIVLNGVISQETPDKWPHPTRGDVPYATRNDAEIALRFIYAKALHELPGSWAFGVLDSDNDNAWFIRNGDRPLWAFRHAQFNMVASTCDIINRALGLDGLKELIPPGVQFSLSNGEYAQVPRVFGRHRDLQFSPIHSVPPASIV